ATLRAFSFMITAPPCSALFPYTTLFRSLDTIGCASTGNLANAVAAHAARAGLKAWIFVPETLEAPKVIGTGIYGASSVSGTKIRSEEHTSELQSRENLVCRLLLEKKKKK